LFALMQRVRCNGIEMVASLHFNELYQAPHGIT
jgi:hypothetical protein